MRGSTPYHFFYVYLLESVKRIGEFYVGSTRDLRARLAMHNMGKVSFTKRYMPWRLVYYEAYQNESSARIRESRLKNNGNAMIELKKRVGLKALKKVLRGLPLTTFASKSGKGFTLIEIIIAVAILLLIFGLGLLVSMDVYRGYSRRSERDTLVAVLMRARSEALANVHQQKWGACYDGSVPSAPSYVIFSGASYASAVTKDVIPGNPAVTIDTTLAPSFMCSSGGIVFAQLTGDTVSATITLTQGSITSTVSTNTEGAVIW